MTALFLSIYDFFYQRKVLFWLTFAVLIVTLTVAALRIRINEDISQFFPNDERVNKLNYVFTNSRFAERITVTLSLQDANAGPDSLVAVADRLIPEMESELEPWTISIDARVQDADVTRLFKTVREHLPVFLTERDYPKIDSMIQPGTVKSILENNYKELLSPTGIVSKDVILHDPLGFSFLALKKFRELQYDQNFELYENYLITRDQKKLIFFIQPRYPANDTGNNSKLINRLDEIVKQYHNAGVSVGYFGAVAVAVDNAQQLRADSWLTVSLTVALLAAILFGYFRRFSTPFLILIPVAFGALFSLAFVSLMQESISILAIAGGSVILGIAVNYSLHFLVHLRHTHNIRVVIRDLAYPMTLGSATTVLAFLGLQFVNASILNDLGLFAAFSLIGAALCSLVFLPHFISTEVPGKTNEKVTEETVGRQVRPTVVLIILLITPFFFFFANKVTFNEDLNSLNFMSDQTRKAQADLERINNATLAASYFVVQSNNAERVLRKNEAVRRVLEDLKKSGHVDKFSSVSSIVISDSLQQKRINDWNSFWEQRKITSIVARAREAGQEYKFSPVVFDNFGLLLNRSYSPLDSLEWSQFKELFFRDYFIEKNGTTTILTIANIKPSEKESVYAATQEIGATALDRQMLATMFVEYVHDDFNFIVVFTSVIVFIALLIAYGRIELTLITFLPMFITWIWILGIMALIGIEFNIVNVMVSTFIFGLGDDYSIFTTEGLLQSYQFGRRNLASTRTSIFLSAATTICGLGVLIFAKHPALKSIAAISIIGIICVFIISQTLSPWLFHWMVTRRTERGLRPMTFFGMMKTLFTYGFFAFGSIFLTLIGLLLKIIPVASRQKKHLLHSLLCFFTRALIWLTPQLGKTIVNLTSIDFARPSVIIANHSSFLDILLTIGLHPKVILLTNKWVWNSPVFGGVVRIADYYPVTEGAEESIERLRNATQLGYSVVVFPEGTRSADGTIGRFHKGAFFISEKLNIPIQPLLIHGASSAIPKGTMYANAGELSLKFLPGVEASSSQNYSERAKEVSRLFKAEFEQFRKERETPRYFRHLLVSNYLYKGPVLEWYTRIKLRLENYYEPFNRLTPANAKVLDLGCGYGYLPYMLHFVSRDREIVGVDYDGEKIETAINNFSKNDRLTFLTADITTFNFEDYDVIIIADVLHYLEPALQESIIVKSFAALRPGGKLIIREGDADLMQRHKGTVISEIFSVKILKFNKSVNKLHFLSGKRLAELAGRHNHRVSILDETKYTSNVIFVVEKNRTSAS